MAYRCSSCNLFCSLDEPEFEASEPEYDGDEVSVEIEATFNSQCCGDTAGSATYTATGNPDFDHKEECVSGKAGDAEYTVEAADPQATDRYQTTDRHGKPIKNPRYQRHFYGVEVDVTVTCDECAASETVTASDEQGPPEEA